MRLDKPKKRCHRHISHGKEHWDKHRGRIDQIGHNSDHIGKPVTENRNVSIRIHSLPRLMDALQCFLLFQYLVIKR